MMNGNFVRVCKGSACSLAAVFNFAQSSKTQSGWSRNFSALKTFSACISGTYPDNSALGEACAGYQN